MNRFVSEVVMQETVNTNTAISQPEVLPSGAQLWKRNGQLHREDGPAVIRPDGTQKWYLDGKQHRLDGPSALYPDGAQEWHVNGLHHRVGGPAIIGKDGTELWYLKGQRHRRNGPAVVRPNGDNEWWIEGKQYSPDDLAFAAMQAFRKGPPAALIAPEKAAFRKQMPHVFRAWQGGWE